MACVYHCGSVPLLRSCRLRNECMQAIYRYLYEITNCICYSIYKLLIYIHSLYARSLDINYNYWLVYNPE